MYNCIQIIGALHIYFVESRVVFICTLAYFLLVFFTQSYNQIQPTAHNSASRTIVSNFALKFTCLSQHIQLHISLLLVYYLCTIVCTNSIAISAVMHICMLQAIMREFIIILAFNCT